MGERGLDVCDRDRALRLVGLNCRIGEKGDLRHDRLRRLSLHGLEPHDRHLHADLVPGRLRQRVIVEKALRLSIDGLRRAERGLESRSGGRSGRDIVGGKSRRVVVEEGTKTGHVISSWIVAVRDTRADGLALDSSADRLSRQGCGRSGHGLLRPADRLHDRVPDLGVVETELGDDSRRVGCERGRCGGNERIAKAELAGREVVLGPGDQRMDLRVGRLLEPRLSVGREGDSGKAREQGEQQALPSPITRPDAAALTSGDRAETIGAAAIAVSDMAVSSVIPRRRVERGAEVQVAGVFRRARSRSVRKQVQE